MFQKRLAMVGVALLAASVAISGLAGPARAADLKQLAEQLVNLTTKEKPDSTTKPAKGTAGKKNCNGDGEGSCKRIREGGRTVGAGQAAIAIQEEGANVKKEKGVEDVE